MSKSAQHQIGKGNEVLLQRPNISRVRTREYRYTSFIEMIVTVQLAAHIGMQLTLRENKFIGLMAIMQSLKKMQVLQVPTNTQSLQFQNPFTLKQTC